jgi:hypothetical protein
MLLLLILNVTKRACVEIIIMCTKHDYEWSFRLEIGFIEHL